MLIVAHDAIEHHLEECFLVLVADDRDRHDIENQDRSLRLGNCYWQNAVVASLYEDGKTLHIYDFRP